MHHDIFDEGGHRGVVAVRMCKREALGGMEGHVEGGKNVLGRREAMQRAIYTSCWIPSTHEDTSRLLGGNRTIAIHAA